MRSQEITAGSAERWLSEDRARDTENVILIFRQIPDKLPRNILTIYRTIHGVEEKHYVRRFSSCLETLELEKG